MRLLEPEHAREMTKLKLRSLEFSNLHKNLLCIIGSYPTKNTERFTIMRTIARKDRPETYAAAVNLVDTLRGGVVDVLQQVGIALLIPHTQTSSCRAMDRRRSVGLSAIQSRSLDCSLLVESDPDHVK